MARPPYQPSLLRLTHGVTALLVLAAWLSGLFVYSRYDGRWGRLPFTPGGNWIDLHGQAGFLLLPLGLAFAAYASAWAGRACGAPPTPWPWGPWCWRWPPAR